RPLRKGELAPCDFRSHCGSGGLAAHRCHGGLKPRRPAAHKLCLEPLEDRCLLDASFGDWGNVTNLGNIVNTPYLDQRGTISKDGLSLYFGSNRPGSVGTVEGSDLYVTP